MPLNNCGPEGGLTNSCIAVSSMPAAFTVIFICLPASHSVRLSVPYRVAPVPYIILFESKGSISNDSVIHPSLGFTSAPGRPVFEVPPQYNHGHAVISCVYLKVRLG